MKISLNIKRLAIVTSGLLIVLMTFEANADVLNGRFDSGIHEWNDDSFTGLFKVNEGRGILETGSGGAT